MHIFFNSPTYLSKPIAIHIEIKRSTQIVIYQSFESNFFLVSHHIRLNYYFLLCDKISLLKDQFLVKIHIDW